MWPNRLKMYWRRLRLNKSRLIDFIGKSSLTVVDAMGMIDTNARGILFIADDNNVLLGCVTDGDIRRWILKTGELSTSVNHVMNKSPKYLYVEQKNKAYSMMRKKTITAVPILNNEMQIVDIVVLNEEDRVTEGKTKKSLSQVPVIIMAGGKGTRLYPYTKILPKPLIPIGETPIVERIIDCYLEYGVKKFFMSVNYKKSMIKSYFNDISTDYEIKYVEEDKPLGTCGSIKLIENKFVEPLFVANCDALILADYADIYDYHVDSGNMITVVSALKNITIPYGVIHSTQNGELVDIEEKPKLSYCINTGMYIINPDVIEMIPDDEVFHMTDLVKKVMNQGGKVGTYPVSEDSFLDMGELSEMKRMEQKLNIISDK